MNRAVVSVCLVPLIALLIAGCAKEQQVVEVVRPVRTLTVAAERADLLAEFSGEVRPRYESRLGFRIGGKISRRLVDVGAQVSKGQVLAQLDPQDLKLAEAAARSNVTAAVSQYELAKADLARYRDLRAKNFISQAELDRRQAAHDSALAQLNAVRAQLGIQDNQAEYAALRADADGVITAVEAEAGQVVTSGQTVVRLAQTAEKEIAIGVPEDQVEAVRAAKRVEVSLWAAPGRVSNGRIRETAPAADPATRTYAVRVAVADPPAGMRWGMTANVRFSAQTPVPLIRVPLSALLKTGEHTMVWVLDPASSTVRSVPVTIAGPNGNDALLSNGLAPGQVVVTAGAHLLQPGQKVRLLSDEPSRPAAAPATAPAAAKAGS
ncbi:MAG: efflux RND transporter periplasmic adaptor subunit [Sterolibacteriaceae bacterium]|nr:efflux RND transporter periplasmic adaptor subunit [Sterolibacteriaceae bacterium]